MKRALFLVSTSGQGHLVRMRCLASELTMRGWRCSIVGCPDGRLPMQSYTDFDVVVVDGYDFGDEAYLNTGARVVAIVDHPCSDSRGNYTGDRDYPVDLQVNGCPGAYGCPELVDSGIYFEAPREPSRVLMGADYAILRPEFREKKLQWNPTHFLGDFRNPKDRTAQQMADDMSRFRLVICHGGMTSLELACMGVPSLIIERGPDELFNRAMLTTVGAARWIGHDEWTEVLATKGPDGAEHFLIGAASAIASQADALRVMSAAGRNLVDGLGARRVANAIEDL